MKPQFTTPCYIRIDDARKRREVGIKLKKVGYKVCCNITARDSKYPTIVANPRGGNGEAYAECVDDLSICKEFLDFIDCGTNIALFLDLAGMRSDTDKGQWFLRIDTKEMGKCNTKDFSKSKLRQGGWRKATAIEIISWYNKKGETK